MSWFKSCLGRETNFEEIWRQRDSHLEGVPSFQKFNLVRGKMDEDGTFTLYASPSVWQSENDFLNWTKSDAFRQTHKGAGEHSDVYLGHPEFEGFTVVL